MLRDHHTVATNSRTNKSKITNGAQLLRGIDMRSATGRRYRDLVRSYADGLGVLDERRMALVRTAAGIGVKLEAMQAEIVRGERIDVRLLIRLANSQARALRALGEEKAQAEPAADPGAALKAHLAEIVGRRRAEEAERVRQAELEAEDKNAVE
jgi:hypothetical protein